jgi:5-methylcytosine-specific restriction protein A
VPKQVCANRPRCLNLVELPVKYCASCAAEGAGKDQRPSAAKRGYGARWQKASKAYLAAHPIAVDWFGEHNGVLYPAEETDHIVPHRGDMMLFWDSDNWQGLTKRDHSRKTAMEDGGFGHTRTS